MVPYREVTFEELMTPPNEAITKRSIMHEPVPEWFAKVLRGVVVADHVGDVWDSILSHTPLEWRPWLKQVASREYVDDGTGEGPYRIYVDELPPDLATGRVPTAGTPTTRSDHRKWT